MTSALLIPAVDLGTEAPTFSTRPVALPAANRGSDLELRVTAPTTGTGLPIVVFSHGFAELMDSYAPLAEFWAAHGFVVLQPAHLDSHRYGLAPTDPRFPTVWRSRIDDLTRTLDGLDEIESSVRELDGRMDRDRIAVAGHSWGATTASALIGARIIGPDGSVGETMADSRVRAGVLFAVAGTGGENLTPFAAEHFSFMNPDFAAMAPDALIVAGDHDQSPLSTRGPDWWTDAYTQSPGPKALLTLAGAEHSLGGIAGYSTHDITDWSLERIALLQRISTAYLHASLGIDHEAWAEASAAMSGDSPTEGRIDGRIDVN
jgi:dienelactone hydrolase